MLFLNSCYESSRRDTDEYVPYPRIDRGRVSARRGFAIPVMDDSPRHGRLVRSPRSPRSSRRSDRSNSGRWRDRWGSRCSR